ncbi:hypothetical protein MHBO_001490, partial [Bonamia ostreae]
MLPMQQREKIVSLIAEMSIKNKNMHKSLNLLIFRQNVFNFKIESRDTKMANLLATMSHPENKNAKIDIAGLANESSIFESVEKLTDFLVKNEKEQSKTAFEVIWAFLCHTSFGKSASKSVVDLSKKTQNSSNSEVPENKNFLLFGKFEKADFDKIESFQLVKIIEKNYENLDWLNLIENFPKTENFGRTENIKLEIGKQKTSRLLDTLLKLIQAMPNPKLCFASFLKLLYGNPWNDRSVHFELIKASLESPKKFSLRTSYQLKNSDKYCAYLLESKRNIKTANEDEKSRFRSLVNPVVLRALLRFEEYREDVRRILMEAARACPVLLFTAFSDIKTTNELKTEAMKAIFDRFLMDGKKSASILFSIDFEMSLRLLEQKFEDSNNSRISINRNASPIFVLCDLTSEITESANWKITAILRMITNKIFSVDFAIRSFENGRFTKFEKWLKLQLENSRNSVMVKNSIFSLLENDRKNQIRLIKQKQSEQTTSLGYKKTTIEMLAAIIDDRHMQNFKSRFSHMSKILVSKRLKNLFGRLHNGSSFGKEVEEIKILSDEDKNTATAFILDEAKEGFPDSGHVYSNEAAKTISHFIGEKSLSRKMHFRLESETITFLRQFGHSTLFTFGATILRAIVRRIESFPLFCHEALRIAEFKTHFPATFKLAKSVVAKTVKKSKIHKKESDLFADRKKKTVDNLKEELAEATKEKITFLLNNLSALNYRETVDFVEEEMCEQFYEYFARYLVCNKVMTEGNFYFVYLRLFRQLC